MSNEIKKTKVSSADMDAALALFGFEKDAILLTHSSLKALGVIEGGAEGVISALERAVPDGTLVFPTLSQKNFNRAFQDWHLDRPSDVGLITETFRKQPGSLRSDNPTHSVSARGRDAADLVGGPADKGERMGIFGPFCFSHYSPWQKMYDSRERYGRRAYVLFWGVTMLYSTLKHLAEYRFVEELIAKVKRDEDRARLASEIAVYPMPAGGTVDTLMWPFYDSEKFQETLFAEGLAKKVPLGDGYLIAADVYEMMKRTERALREDTEQMLLPHIYDWVRRAREAGK